MQADILVDYAWEIALDVGYKPDALVRAEKATALLQRLGNPHPSSIEVDAVADKVSFKKICC